jgi:uncharacterized protein
VVAVAAADVAVAVVGEARNRDRIGISWRPELAAGIYLRLAEIDVVEIIAENYADASRRDIAALRALARNVPVSLHGVSMGLVSSAPAERRAIDRMAKLVDAVQPESWSEHLAFVRAGGVEIGHLAAPPRSQATVEGALRNIDLATRVIGFRPQLENIATLIAPPASTLDEAAWVGAIINGAGTGLLLDLHNLYANAVNFGQDPFALLAGMPLASVCSVHIAGGVWINTPSGAKRLLDDHLHDPQDLIYALLARLAELAPQPLTVILERDGVYPAFDVLMSQLHAARDAVLEGRLRAGLVRSTT